VLPGPASESGNTMTAIHHADRGPDALIGKSLTVTCDAGVNGLHDKPKRPCRIHMLHRWRLR